ncbi:hypothetical protein D3C78_1940840 [compost metagenome]
MPTICFGRQGYAVVYPTRFTLHYRFGASTHHIAVRQTAATAGPAQFSLDGTLHDGEDIPLIDDGRDHQVEIQHPFASI